RGVGRSARRRGAARVEGVASGTARLWRGRATDARRRIRGAGAGGGRVGDGHRRGPAGAAPDPGDDGRALRRRPRAAAARRPAHRQPGLQPAPRAPPPPDRHSGRVLHRPERMGLARLSRAPDRPARRAHARHPAVRDPVLPGASRAGHLRRQPARRCRPGGSVTGRAPEVLARADAAIVASGTATLEAALALTPMVVVYRASWLTWWIGRMLVRVKFLSLVNLISGRAVVPELLQRECIPERIAA